jgi:hypothetical protein
MSAGRRRRLAGLAAALLLGASCSNEPAAETQADDPEPCSVFDAEPVAGGEVVAVTFPTPLSLDEVEALAADAGGEPLALWRVDPVCVADVAGDGPSFPIESGGQRPSSFAYWHGDEAVARQDEGPPATDGGWSTALRERFLQEWDAARAPGVEFVGAAVLVPGSGSLAAGEEAVAVPSYRTDGVGVLYLEGHEQALAPRFPPPAAACDQSSSYSVQSS